MNQMSIGQLSKQAGVKVTTIRYYESIGLLAEPERSQSGRRLYGQKAVQTLSFVRHGRDLASDDGQMSRVLRIVRLGHRSVTFRGGDPVDKWPEVFEVAHGDERVPWA